MSFGIAFVPPERPLLTLRRRTGWASLDFQELWRYRELLVFLTWRDVAVRYKQTILGMAWAVLQPLGAMLVFTLFFGRLAQMPSDGVPYALFAYAGLLPWVFFSAAVTNSGNSLVSNAHVITKVYFPRMVIPGAAVLAALVDFVIACLVLVPLQLYYGVLPGRGIALLPIVILILVVLATAIGMWLSALNVAYRDVRHVQPFLVQLWMFATPVIYPATIVPESWRWVLNLNPLAGILGGFRAALFDKPVDTPALCMSAGMAVVMFVSAAFSFRHMESRFADAI